MRDILQSSKGRTQSARDYGRDAGDYVPLLERRPRQQYQSGFLQRMAGNRSTVARGWNSGALAQAQESKRDVYPHPRARGLVSGLPSRADVLEAIYVLADACMPLDIPLSVLDDVHTLRTKLVKW